MNSLTNQTIEKIKENGKPSSLINRDTKILNKILSILSLVDIAQSNVFVFFFLLRNARIVYH